MSFKTDHTVLIGSPSQVTDERIRPESTGPPAKPPVGQRSRDSTIVPLVCQTVFWASIAFVVFLWVYNGGPGNMIAKRPQGLFDYPGRLAGLVSADLMLIQVFLMARIPVIERAYGRDRLVRIHRLVGFSSLNLLVAHIVLLAVAYAVRDHKSVLSSTWWMVSEWRGMVLATAATFLFVLVGFTSARAARRRLRYHTWHLLHLYTLLGVGLAIPHEIWAGNDFKPRLTQVYIVGLYVAAVVSLLVFRVLLPIALNRRHQMVVDRLVHEAPGSYSVYLRGRDLHRLQAKAGQFCMWRFKDGHGWTRANPYALSAAPDGKMLRITAKEVGPNSKRLRALRPGTRVLFEGPYGRFTSEARIGRKLTLLASGIGITPIRALLEALDYESGEAVLIYRASTEKDFVFRQELDELAEHRGIRVVYLPGHRMPNRSSWQPEKATADDHVALLDLVPDFTEHDVFICGPDSWAKTASGAAQRAGVAARNIHIERFAF
jgi:predicted ferric reductase